MDTCKLNQLQKLEQTIYNIRLFMTVICTVWKLVIMTLWSVSITTSSLGWQQWMQAVFRRLNLSEQVTHCRVK